MSALHTIFNPQPMDGLRDDDAIDLPTPDDWQEAFEVLRADRIAEGWECPDGNDAA